MLLVHKYRMTGRHRRRRPWRRVRRVYLERHDGPAAARRPHYGWGGGVLAMTQGTSSASRWARPVGRDGQGPVNQHGCASTERRLAGPSNAYRPRHRRPAGQATRHGDSAWMGRWRAVDRRTPPLDATSRPASSLFITGNIHKILPTGTLVCEHAMATITADDACLGSPFCRGTAA